MFTSSNKNLALIASVATMLSISGFVAVPAAFAQGVGNAGGIGNIGSVPITIKNDSPNPQPVFAKLALPGGQARTIPLGIVNTGQIQTFNVPVLTTQTTNAIQVNVCAGIANNCSGNTQITAPSQTVSSTIATNGAVAASTTSP